MKDCEKCKDKGYGVCESCPDEKSTMAGAVLSYLVANVHRQKALKKKKK